MTIAVLEGGTTAQHYDPIWAEPTAPRPALNDLSSSARLVWSATVVATAALSTILNHLSGVPTSANLFMAQTILSLPMPQPHVKPHLQEMITEIRRLTGWSERAVAARVGTSHPTIAAAASGSSQAFVRSPQAYARLEALYSVVTRIAPLAKAGPLDVDRALTTAPGTGRVSALANLEANDPASAYLAALDVLRPPRTDGKIRSRFPRAMGNDTAALTD
jgi:hypothetical protein